MAGKQINTDLAVDGNINMKGQLVVTTNDSRLSDSRPANGGNADTVDSCHADITANGNTVAKRDSNGDIYARVFRMSNSIGDAVPSKILNMQSDGSIFSTSATQVQAFLGLGSTTGTLALNNISINNALSTNQSYTGTYEVATVGESVVFGDVLYLKFSDGKYWKAKADAYTTTPATRMALGTIAANGTGNLLIEGLVRLDSWAFAANNVWLSAATAGAITTTQPSTTGNQIQKIGVAFSSTKLQFRPSFDIGEK